MFAVSSAVLLKGRPKPGDDLVGDELPPDLLSAERARAAKASKRGEPAAPSEAPRRLRGVAEAPEEAPAEVAEATEPAPAEADNLTPPSVPEPEAVALTPTETDQPLARYRPVAKHRILLSVLVVPAGSAGEVLAYRLSEAGTLAPATALGQSRAMARHISPDAR